MSRFRWGVHLWIWRYEWIALGSILGLFWLDRYGGRWVIVFLALGQVLLYKLDVGVVRPAFQTAFDNAGTASFARSIVPGLPDRDYSRLGRWKNGG